MYRVKQVVKRLLRLAGFEVVRSSLPPKPALKNYYCETDDTFRSIFREGVGASGSAHDPEVIHQRLYNAVQFLRYASDLEGDVAECGAFRGLSSYLFCSYLRLADPDFNGQGYHIFDSFQGLSQPTEHDVITNSNYGVVGAPSQSTGAFEATLEIVKATLKDFPFIEYHRGWIPESFDGVPEKVYKFVHLDLDLYEPIKGAIQYFYPRMVKGGVIVIDEYGFPRWPGAQKAVDEFCLAHGVITPVSLTTGNGVLIKK
jgi:O-methyltransferase